MKSVFVCLALMVSASVLPACGTESKATPYVELTPQEKARQALDKQDFATAVTLYKDVIAKYPNDYQSYRFLSAAYAALGGFDLLKAVAGTITSSGSNLMDTLANYLPRTPTDDQINSLKLATETLLALPAEQRSYDHPEIETASSAAQQLSFYQAAYSLIYLNKFTTVTDAGTLDPSNLETMTDADVDNILGNLESIATTVGGGALATAASDFISQLDTLPGETRRDKLINYLNEHPT